jgi:prevent-host-death family protein
MSTIGAYEAKTKFSELLDRVEKGERVTITRHGRPVAELVPSKAPRDRERARQAMDRLREIGNDATLSDLTWEDIKKMRDEGRPGCD